MWGGGTFHPLPQVVGRPREYQLDTIDPTVPHSYGNAYIYHVSNLIDFTGTPHLSKVKHVNKCLWDQVLSLNNVQLTLIIPGPNQDNDYHSS